MAHLPVFRADGFAAIERALQLRRMLGMYGREHFLLAQVSVGEIFDLGREPEVRIGIECVRIGAAATDAHPAGSAPKAAASAGAPAKSRQSSNAVGQYVCRFTAQLARPRIVHPKDRK